MQSDRISYAELLTTQMPRNDVAYAHESVLLYFIDVLL